VASRRFVVFGVFRSAVLHYSLLATSEDTLMTMPPIKSIQRSKRMPRNGSFAERSLDLLKPSGERVAFRVGFGPVLLAGRDFCCRVRFNGWVQAPPDVRGRDSLEALLPAVGLVHGMLDDFVRRGGRVLWPGTNNDYDLVHFVSSPEWRRAEVASPNRRPSRRRRVRVRGKGGGR